mmetsp:Transcript_29640/g.78531  ORF Transcript_29640/g.78531 Transcript_29640/m.78531 type:complete len:215 (+) Transcript_29640:348-992(+)
MRSWYTSVMLRKRHFLGILRKNSVVPSEEWHPQYKKLSNILHRLVKVLKESLTSGCIPVHLAFHRVLKHSVNLTYVVTRREGELVACKFERKIWRIMDGVALDVQFLKLISDGVHNSRRCCKQTGAAVYNRCTLSAVDSDVSEHDIRQISCPPRQVRQRWKSHERMCMFLVGIIVEDEMAIGTRLSSEANGIEVRFQVPLQRRMSAVLILSFLY